MKINLTRDVLQITGITLFILLLTNSLTFSSNNFPQANGMDGLVPSLEPTQHISSNPNLYVSAENPLFKNYFAGPQVIEVIVNDPDINRLDQAYGEPVVTINGKRLRMAQGIDGNWYAYFADRNQAIAASNTQLGITGKGLNFGGFCDPTSTFSPMPGVIYTETDGFTLARGGFGSVNHTSTVVITSSNLGTCTNVQGILTANQMEHVVRLNQTLNSNPSGFNADSTYSQVWPIIQLFDFSSIPSAVIVDYQKNGGDQIVNLIFDRIPKNIITPVSNRSDYPQGAQVQADLIDPQLNIDPTDEDSWTWGTSPTNNTVFYQAFSRNGEPDADGTLGMQDLSGNLTALMFNHNGILTTYPSPQGVQVAELQSNGIQKLFKDSNGHYRTQSISGPSVPTTLLEIQPNAGIFADYDAGGIADLKILDHAKRDTSFTVKYNDVSYSVVVKFYNAQLTMGWPSTQTTNIQYTNQPEKQSSFISFLKEFVLKNLFFIDYLQSL
ncbi:MAG: hypothetical protein WBV92_03945 [Nitrosotalea sp.]